MSIEVLVQPNGLLLVARGTQIIKHSLEAKDAVSLVSLYLNRSKAYDTLTALLAKTRRVQNNAWERWLNTWPYEDRRGLQLLLSREVDEHVVIPTLAELAILKDSRRIESAAYGPRQGPGRPNIPTFNPKAEP